MRLVLKGLCLLLISGYGLGKTTHQGKDGKKKAKIETRADAKTTGGSIAARGKRKLLLLIDWC